MQLLYFFENLRIPVLDTFFMFITRLGEETLFILAGLLFFWCIDKRKGYYILAVGFAGTVINQFLKLAFRIPRPWVKNPDFTIVETARDAATGYSFPSGHTQNAVGVFGCIARSSDTPKSSIRIILRGICILICILVPISRMYLGVHTPADVGVSLLIATVLVFALYPLVERATKTTGGMHRFFGIMTAVAAIFCLYVGLFPFPEDIDAVNFSHGYENAYKILGCVLGLWLAYAIDNRYIHFETTALWWVQLLKLVLGLIPILLMKTLFKAPLNSLLNGSPVAGMLRYFLIVIFAGAIWPMTFVLFSRLGKKQNKSESSL